MKLFMILLITVLSIIQLKAQETDPDLITDRPDQAESSITVPHKSLQIETGFSLEQDNNNLFEITNLTYNSTLLRYGLLENLELRFGFEYVDIKNVLKVTETETTTNGLAPLVLGFKINISEQNGAVPEMALLSHLALPNTGLDDFQSETLTPDIILALSYELSPKLSTGANLGVEWTDGSSKASGIYSWVFGIAISDKAGAFIETYGSFAKEENFDSRIDGGITYLIVPNLQFDVAGGFGLTEISPDYYIGCGLSFRIQK